MVVIRLRAKSSAVSPGLATVLWSLSLYIRWYSDWPGAHICVTFFLQASLQNYNSYIKCEEFCSNRIQDPGCRINWEIPGWFKVIYWLRIDLRDRPATGTADIYFKQLMSLGSAGFRVISVWVVPAHAMLVVAQVLLACSGCDYVRFNCMFCRVMQRT